jgi:vancomycin resistance protein YoaR
LQRETVKKKRLTRTWWFWLLIAVCIVVVAGVAAVVADQLVYYDEVHAGVSVYGMDLGGMTEQQATAALAKMVGAKSGSVTLNGVGKTWTVTPADAGRTIDVQGAVAAALAVSHEGNFFHRVGTCFELYWHHRDLPLTRAVDTAKLETLVDRIALELHVTPINAQLTVENGSIKVIQGVTGRDVDTATLVNRLVPLFVNLKTANVDVPLVAKEPVVQVEDNQPALAQAKIMISTPITLTNHDKSWTLSPVQLISWLDFRTEDTNGIPKTIPYLVEGRMTSYISSLAPDVHRDPTDAGFKSDDRATPQVIPGVEGEQLDVTGTATGIATVAEKATGRTLEVAITKIEPDFSTADAQDTKFTQLSTFSTTYACPANRQTNVKLATKYSTNVFLAPGQELNFDKQIGPRIASRGWQLAPGITGPNTLEDVLGGGICQVSTTMFNAVFFAGLKVTERHNHSIFINHYPLGRDATVTGGGKNLRFVNDTDHYIWVRGSSTGVTTTISIWGTSDGRKVSYSVGKFYNVRGPSTVKVNDPTLPVGQTKVIDQGQTGRQLKTTRLVTMPDGTVLHNDTWISTWPMYPTSVAVGTKVTTTTTQ